MNPKLEKLKAMLRESNSPRDKMLLTAIDGLEAEANSYRGDASQKNALRVIAAICRDLPGDREKLEVIDTPRTDAHQNAFNENGKSFSIDDIVEAYEHARTLEIELRAANLKNAQEDGE